MLRVNQLLDFPAYPSHLYLSSACGKHRDRSWSSVQSCSSGQVAPPEVCGPPGHREVSLTWSSQALLSPELADEQVGGECAVMGTTAGSRSEASVRCSSWTPAQPWPWACSRPSLRQHFHRFLAVSPKPSVSPCHVPAAPRVASNSSGQRDPH